MVNNNYIKPMEGGPKSVFCLSNHRFASCNWSSGNVILTLYVQVPTPTTRVERLRVR